MNATYILYILGNSLSIHFIKLLFYKAGILSLCVHDAQPMMETLLSTG